LVTAILDSLTPPKIAGFSALSDGDRAFSNASVTVWNSLPVLIRNQENFSILSHFSKHTILGKLLMYKF
jgi:hypothetical protein